jgi:rubrerythrin
MKMTREKAEYYLKDEIKTSGEYAALGLRTMAEDEARHARFWKRYLARSR